MLAQCLSTADSDGPALTDPLNGDSNPWVAEFGPITVGTEDLDVRLQLRTMHLMDPPVLLALPSLRATSSVLSAPEDEPTPLWLDGEVSS